MDALNEEQQIEQLKDWWKRYGNILLSVVTVALLVFTGYQYWTRSQQNKVLEQSMLFDSLSQKASSLAENPNNQAQLTQFMEEGRKLISIKPDSAYSVYTQLLQAKILVEKNDLPKAQAILQTASEQKADVNLRSIVQLRLARVYAEQNKPDDALNVLNSITEVGFTPSKEELKGDILVAKKDTAGAIKAYQTAYDMLKERKTARPSLVAKLQALGVVVEQIDSPEVVDMKRLQAQQSQEAMMAQIAQADLPPASVEASETASAPAQP